MNTRRRPWSTIVGVVTCLAVAGVLAATAMGAFGAKNGAYAGRTSQGEAVSFTVKNDKVKHPKFTMQLGGCTVGPVTTTETAKIHNSGRFTVDMPGEDYFKGKFLSKKKVTGTAHLEPFSDCPGGTVSYTAHLQ